MVWRYYLSLLQGSVTAHDKDGFFSVLDNRVRELELQGLHLNTHNMLVKEELISLFNSNSLDSCASSKFQARILFTVGVLTGMLPTALSTISVKQFEKGKLQINVWKITGAVVSVACASKKPCRMENDG